jgi:uncharacterized protein
MARDNCRLALALSVVVAGAACAGPAGAQLAGGRAAFDARERAVAVQFRDFFRPFWGDRGGGGFYPNNSYDPYNPFSQRQQTYESLKPPAPAARKADTPPPTETVLVIGDSLADWLGYGLEEALADTPQIGIVRKIRPYSGLVRYEARADAPDWSAAVKDVLATEKPAAIVVMLGLNDRLPLRERAPSEKTEKGEKTEKTEKKAAPSQGQGAAATAAAPSKAPAGEATQPDADQPPAANEAQHRPPPPGGNYEFHTDKWAELYEKRIDEMITALKSKGVPVVWVGLPAIRGTKSTSDMLYLDELYRARAEKAGILYIDIWDGFVDEQGRYTQQGPDFQGQTRRLRTYDGVNFTKYGAEKLAHYVEHELRRVLNNPVMPVALPGPEEQAPGKGGAGAKPAIGPVVPLGAIGSGDGGELLGASRPAQKEADPLATRVLSRGDALAAPPGRADDFSWPRSDINTDGASDSRPEPAPASPAPKGAGKAETNKTEENKAETNKTEINKNDTNKADTNKADAAKNETKKADVKKEQAAAAAPPAPAAAPAKPRPQRFELDGAPPRPPLPVGPAAAR